MAKGKGTPALTDEARARALERAMAARRERAEIRASLREGALTVREVLYSSDEAAARMPVAHVIGTQGGYGKVRVERLMQELGISPSRRVGGLGKRQREALAAHFD